MGRTISHEQRRIYLLAGLSIATALLAVVVPRFVPAADGMAAAATGVLVFLALLVVAAVISLVAMSLTFRAYSLLPWPTRVAGIGPALVLGVALAWIVLFLRY